MSPKTKTTNTATTEATQPAKRLVLLDSHAILHRAYHALPDFASSKGEPTGGLYGLSSMLIRIIQDLKPDYIAACFDLPEPTYRHEAYKDYKAGRAKTDDALIAQIKRSRDVFAAFNIPMYDKAGFEADDMLGTIVEQLKDTNIDIIIASGDMDTLQLVNDKKVRVFTLKKGLNDTILYDEDKVIERYGFGPKLLPDFKGLRGDPSDNIIGIKGIGEKTATTLITTFGTVEDMYVALKSEGGEAKFEAAGIKARMIELLRAGEDEALFSKTLATIRRDAPITFEVPEKTWKDTVSMDAITALFTELEFRTLGDRLRRAILGQPVVKGGAQGNEDATGEALEGGAAVSEAVPAETVDPLELKKVGIAVWLQNSDLTNPTLEDILNFTRTKTFAEAKETAFKWLNKEGLNKVYETIELPLIDVLERADALGVKIDRAYMAKLSKDYHAELDKIQASIYKHAGQEFNINSPKQLGTILFDVLGLKPKNQKKTAGGARSTRESELEKMKDDSPVIAEILNYRELQKLLSTYIDTIPLLLDANDRLHSTSIQTGAATGRLSSQNPNLQNIPNKTELGRAIRHAFIAEKGFTLASFDYSQVELRIAAFLSKDEQLLEIFRSGRDVHTEVAARVFKVAPENVDKEMRRRAKVINFGIIYGMGVLALKQNLGTDRAEAQKFYDEYFATFSGLARYLDAVRAEAARKGYTETYFGRRRFFQGINSKIPFIKAAAERMAINAPIQGTEADVLKLAMIHIDNYIQENKLTDKVRLLLQVHDELVYEIAEGELDVVRKIRELMEQIIKPADIEGITLAASANVGDNWGSVEPIK